jgi:DNA-binding MarR family transcriptional regulator
MPKQAQDMQVTKRNYSEFEVINDRLVYLETGEIVDDVFVILDYYNITTELEKDDSGGFYHNNWNKRHKFTKFYQVDSRLLNQEISIQAKGLLFVLMSYLAKSTNEVIINGNRPTNSDLAKLTGVSRATIKRVLSELEECNAIKRLEETKKRAILVNPHICFNGKNISKFTINQFKK